METLHNKIKNHLAKTLSRSIKETFDLDREIREIYKSLSAPPNLKMGHIAFPCFSMSKTLKKSPKMISEELESSIKKDQIINCAKCVGPYLNFFIKQDFIGKEILQDILKEDFFNVRVKDKTERVMIEYSQPNTHKMLHVGHMRNLCLGNSLVRLYKYSNDEVIAATYPGDVGTHVAKCLWYLKYHSKYDLRVLDKGTLLGKIYTEATALLEKQKDSDQEEKNREQLTLILKELETGKGEFYDLWIKTRRWSLDLFEKAYAWADVKFDRWFFESEVDSSSLEFAKDLYKQGKYVKSEGAIGMDLKDDKLGFCIIIKSDGNGMYATKDLDLAHKKFEEFKLDKSYYIVDKRQALHFKQVFKVLERIGFPHAGKSEHLQYDFVELPNGAMSSRKGNIVPLMDLVSSMEKKIKDDYLGKYSGDWTDDEIEKTATMIANGAIKYGMLKMDNTRKIVFDMNEWLKLDGETGPYLQYVYARINSLCNKLNFSFSESTNYSILEKEQEVNLLLKVSEFNDIAFTAADQSRPSVVCSYLFELGKLFNSFYAECPIGKAENEELKLSRLHLAKSVGLVMEKGLDLLGIKAPKRM